MFLQVKEPRQLSAVLIDANIARREMLQLTLSSRDINLVDICADVDAALASGSAPALFLFYAETVDQQSLADLATLRASCDTAILVLLETAAQNDIDLLTDNGADHVLPVGLQSDRFYVATASALAQSRKRQRLETETMGARQALEDTKRIARAKMILIARHGIAEDEAHRRIQKLSMERNLPLAEMAQKIIDAEDLLC
ncbi:MAG: ANTAR domain-containing protein [Pseudomonadota bacterium]